MGQPETTKPTKTNGSVTNPETEPKRVQQKTFTEDEFYPADVSLWDATENTL
jgi:hypothetical protein